MKKIGYIYKYNQSEGMGILMFGIWKVKSYWGSSIIKNTPILFSANDLLSDVSTGQLVYFDLEGNTASNIEHASLSNFKVEYINNIIRCKDGEMESSFYRDNTIISFECLDNIIIPNEDEQTQGLIADEDQLSIYEFDDDDDFELYGLDYGNSDDSRSSSITETDAIIVKDVTNNLPKSIVDLYNCFGKYKHNSRNESTSVNVFDLSLWVDSEVLSTEYYGKKSDELLFLYDLFVLKKRYNRNGNVIPVKLDNDCISPTWSLLLSKFSEDDLKKIINEAPKLQPALPLDFCKKNIDVLTSNQGMPNVEICKLYCLDKISKAETISDYKYIKHKLYVYRNCNANHLKDEGTPMCKMGKTCIRNLEKRLEEQYNNVIKQNVIAQLLNLCEEVNVVDELRDSSSDDFEKVAFFIEHYNNLRNNFLEYKVCEKILDSYEKLSNSFKDALKSSLLNCVNESAISATQSKELTPFVLSYHVELFGNWILESTKQQIKELVNDRFSQLDGTEELSCAYTANYITKQQYYDRYKQITSGFNAYQFLSELFNCNVNDSPLEIQWYVTSSIINQLGYKNLDSYNFKKYVKVEYTDSIYDIRSLLRWLADYGHLNDKVLKKAEEEICSVLSNDERWTLFEEKIVKSPGVENIRKYLDNAYIKKNANKELFKHACFQDVMLSDVDSIKDSEVILFIADNLDLKHQHMMQQKATGFLKLYLWQKHPSKSLDWNLIKSHYHELSAESQIKILRFIFGKMASGEISLSFDDLYSEFVEKATTACPSIRGILYILKAKKDDLNVSITPSMIESVIGEEQKQRRDFVKVSKEIFYPCNGYLAISANKFDIEYQSFNGILTKEKIKNKLFYVIKFYDSPVNLFGRRIEWLDSEEVEIAQQVLLMNAPVEVINGQYYIPESHEFFIKQFVLAYEIDDKCGLVSDKERLIELGYLPRNNAYQPLYTNYLRKYEDSDNYICRGGCFGSSDPHNNIPFFWCNKKMCVRRAHFLLPSSKWEEYCFADFFFIVLGQSPDVRESVWRVNSEISQFICDYLAVFKLDERNICSKPLKELDERGTWDEKSSIYRPIYDGEDDEYEEDSEDYLSEQDEPTYNKYNGSYAQDEMGYSDDDIDTIFDGEPDAYWNID